jgi:hypothetical protein
VTISVFWLLVRARDHIMADRRVSLRDRIDAATILWNLAIKAERGAQMEMF